MSNECKELSHGKSSHKLVAEFQKSLGETSVLLLELKTRTGISKTTKLEIDAAVKELQEITITIPNLAAERKSFGKVFDVIKKTHDIWCKIFT